MAVNATPVAGVLIARFAVGLDAQGNPVFRNRRWSGVKPEAADQNVYDAALALAGLQVHPLNAVQRQVTSELVEA
ncbi:MAG: DUF1659 domain-containing protein [Bacillota bacterium]